jgi:hypothetical protein
MTSINSTRAKETQLRKELESTPELALKKESYETSKADKQRKELDAKNQCAINDGTKCIKAKQDARSADVLYQQKEQAYNDALAVAKRTATAETSPIGANPSLWINTILPLIGGVLIRLISRS